jgi:hypothetical protein
LSSTSVLPKRKKEREEDRRYSEELRQRNFQLDYAVNAKKYISERKGRV